MVLYSNSDPIIQSFLKGLSLGESGNRPWEATEYLGVGNIDLSDRPCNQYGFPIWDGYGHPVSHACGPWQFEPATWNELARKYRLDFASLDDQTKGAWLLAEQVFYDKTKGGLYTALKNKQYLTVQGALSETWTSVKGNGSSPGLAKYLIVHGA